MKSHEQAIFSEEMLEPSVARIGAQAMKNYKNYGQQPALPGMGDDEGYITSMREESETLINRYNELSLNTLQCLEGNLRESARDRFPEATRRKLYSHVCAAIVRKLVEIEQQQPATPEESPEALFDLVA